MVARPRAGARRHRPGGAADRGQAEHPRRRRHGVAAEQGQAERRERGAQALGERLVPAFVAQGEAEQHAQRPRALGGEVGEVHRDQLPGDVRRRVAGQIVDALDDHVVGQNQGFAAHLQHRAIVVEASRRRIERERAQGLDEGGFGAYFRTSFATASSRPLTKPVSRAS